MLRPSDLLKCQAVHRIVEDEQKTSSTGLFLDCLCSTSLFTTLTYLCTSFVSASGVSQDWPCQKAARSAQLLPEHLNSHLLLKENLPTFSEGSLFDTLRSCSQLGGQGP